jgi:hypothetical protein
MTGSWESGRRALRYYFHYRNGPKFHLDGKGDELEDLEAALEEGRLSARDLMGLDHGGLSDAYAGGTFEITTGDGTVVGIIAFEELSLGASPGV